MTATTDPTTAAQHPTTEELARAFTLLVLPAIENVAAADFMGVDAAYDRDLAARTGQSRMTPELRALASAAGHWKSSRIFDLTLANGQRTTPLVAHGFPCRCAPITTEGARRWERYTTPKTMA